MMSIRVVSRAGEPLDVQLRAEFGEHGGDIGRGSDCTLVLPDPERRISRKHVQVSWRDGRHFIRLMSTNLPVELDGTPLVPGVEHPLGPGATFCIGPYVLEVSRDAASATSELLAAPPAQSPRPSVFEDLLHAVAPQRPAPKRPEPDEVDLLIGGTSEWDASQGRSDPVAAFYAGMGLGGPGAPAPTAEQLRLAGALLRAMVDGTIGLLAARSAVKRELGADLTLPQAMENNPLKFSPNAEAALKHLLGPPERGYLGPMQAVKDAFDDLKAHEVSVLAGVRGAIEAVLDRFDPKVLESRITDRGVWDRLPVNHKARLWDHYAEMHAELMREIEDDVDALFGRAFLKAYQAQLERLSARRR